MGTAAFWHKPYSDQINRPPDTPYAAAKCIVSPVFCSFYSPVLNMYVMLLTLLESPHSVNSQNTICRRCCNRRNRANTPSLAATELPEITKKRQDDVKNVPWRLAAASLYP
ncbi:hypothetical protein [Paenibacillus thalictri]|uniref:hypothetical protein n=1 Tax=Paenibacillus thalictri TaxID=2527873 RepID=UPI001033030A|nr:hypothetical protein [Paenibacillus thalictri]